jgi:GLPGLI family protein
MNVTIGKLNIYLQGTLQEFYGKFRIYKNYPDQGKTFYKHYSNGKFYRVIENTNFKWKIILDSDTTILGYKCKQARTYFAGRNYVAWFTLDIPISDGPYKFKGLPGLIITIKDTRNQHCFELIKIVKEKKCMPIILTNSKYIDVSAKEFTKVLEAEMAILYNKVSQEDGIHLGSDEAKARSLNRLKSRNNFIEIY